MAGGLSATIGLDGTSRERRSILSSSNGSSRGLFLLSHLAGLGFGDHVGAAHGHGAAALLELLFAEDVVILAKLRRLLPETPLLGVVSRGRDSPDALAEALVAFAILLNTLLDLPLVGPVVLLVPSRADPDGRGMIIVAWDHRRNRLRRWHVSSQVQIVSARSRRGKIHSRVSLLQTFLYLLKRLIRKEGFLVQGTENLTKWWLVLFPLSALFLTLLLVVFVGEAVREAFDPKEFSQLQ